ncbi:MAG: hypothetical protein CL928_05630 [Deltaproteobacteria bacterium]|nr:hypothetical protein [Deltaproteobacteria bacterium]
MTPRKVFLIGTGPLPMDNPREMSFPSLRTRQFLLALLRAGHDVMLACLIPREADRDVRATGEAAPGEPVDLKIQTGQGTARFRYVVVRPDEPGRFLMLRDLRREYRPDVTVTAGPFLPMAAGARAAGDEPLWVDVPGDPMSEAQARAHRAGSADPIHRYREMLGWALARGDAFSVISDAQRGLLVGALGLAGRLTAETVGHEFVRVLPGCVEGLIEWDRPKHKVGLGPLPDAFPALKKDDFVVLFCGGYNTWLDGDTMLDGLLRAMDRNPKLRYVSTGGALRRHDESSYRAFVQRAQSSDHNHRFHFLGWVPGDTLPAIFSRAHLCLFIDLPCYEAEFGARTRILEALERNVPVAATNSCDLTEELMNAGLFHALPTGNPEAVAELLVELAERHASGDPVSLQQNTIPWKALRDRYSIDATTEALLTWVEEPERSPGGVAIDFLEDYWQELAQLQDRLEEVWNSPTWRYLGRGHRLFSRLRNKD